MATRGTVLVTGASTGIGRATALHLAGRGWRVLAGVRRAGDGETLRDAASGELEPLILDVTDAGQIAAAAEAAGPELAGLVNNAGVSVPGPLEFMPLDDFRRQLEINLVAQVALTQAVMASIRRARGRIVFTGSIGARMPSPFLAAYSASKAGVAALAASLRQELRPWGIEVSTVEPGAIATEIWRRGADEGAAVVGRLPPEGRELYAGPLGAMDGIAKTMAERAIPPERVARVMERALTARRPRDRYVVGPDARVQALLVRALPHRALDRIVARQMGLP
jgi:NAD(P)-dependent dehydrogenase (short-subunit alcohol dehydrogenase family)